MLALLAVAGATLSACTPAPAPSPTPTAAFASEEEAFAAAEETYRAYNDTFNRVNYGDPSTFDALDEFTSGSYRSQEREGLSQMHAEGITRSGTTHIVWFKGMSFVDSTITARVCNDVSEVALLDADGTSIVSPDRPPRSSVDLTFSVSDAEVHLVGATGSEDPECS